METLLELLGKPYNLLYSTMVGLAVGWWLISAVGALVFGAFDGLFEVDADFDADADADLDMDGGDGMAFLNGALRFVGVGKVPVTVVLSATVFMVGLTGIGLNAALAAFGLPVDSLWTAAGVFPTALFGGTVMVGYALKPLHAFFPEEKPMTRAGDLVGCVGTVVTGRVDGGFGQVRAKSPAGDEATVSARAMEPGASFAYGDRVYLSEYDPDRQRYYVVEAV